MRIAKWIGIGLAGIAGTILVLVLIWDWNWLRGYASRAGSDASGRTFAIDGDIDVDLGWVSRVRVENVRLGNAEWAKAPEMVEIGLVEFDIDLLELVGGRIVLPELYLNRPVIRLERRDDGTPNWKMGASTGSAAVEATVPEERTEFPVIGHLRIEEGVLGYDAPADAVSIETKISTATGEGGDGSDRVELGGKGSFANEPFELQLTAGSILSLRENDAPYPIDLEAKIGRTSVEAKGSAVDPLTMTGLNFTFSVKGADMADLFPIFRIPLPQTPPYSLAGHLGKDGTTWRFTKFDGRMGDSDLSGNLAYEPREDRPFINAELVSNRLDFDDLAGLIGAEPEAKNKPAAQTETRGAGRVLPDTAIDLARLRAADMDVRFRGKRIRYPALPIDSMDMRARLNNGRLSLDPIEFGMAKGTVSGALVLDGRKDTPYVATDLALRRLDLSEFFEGEQAGVTMGRFGGKVVLAGTGRSVARLLGTADGEIAMSMAGGRLSQLLVELAGIDAAEALPFLFDSDQPVELRCIVGDFVAKNGRLTSRALVIDTTDTMIDGTASIDLAEETLDIRMVAHPKDPSPLAGRTPITVGGTFGNPSVGVDPSGLAARGAAAVALGALLTPLAAIIPFIELGLGKDSDCAALMRQAGARKGR